MKTVLSWVPIVWGNSQHQTNAEFSTVKSPSRRLSSSIEISVALLSGAVLALLCARHLPQTKPDLAASMSGDVAPTSHYPEWPVPAACNKTYLPRGIALSPDSLQRDTKKKDAVPDRLIVVARHREDTSWINVYLPEFPYVIYEVDEPHLTADIQYKTLMNKGNEAMAYLQFILDFYHKLPKHIVFMHSHRGGWHLRDKVPVLRRLKWGSFPYANLRYGPGERLQWVCGNRTNDRFWSRLSCNWVGLVVRPQGMAPRKEDEVGPGHEDEWIESVELHANWKMLFKHELGEAPPILTGPCCAEFMVSRERILKHPLAFYTRLRDWIIDVEIDGYRVGRVLENMWGYIFGEPAVSGPKFECDLLHCDAEQLREALYWRDVAEREETDVVHIAEQTV